MDIFPHAMFLSCLAVMCFIKRPFDEGRNQKTARRTQTAENGLDLMLVGETWSESIGRPSPA
jgi:hypothetical protein